MGIHKINLPVDQIISERQSGMTLDELAEKYGVSLSTIYARMREYEERNLMGFLMGLKRRIKIYAHKIELPVDQIISDYESGMSMIALGKKYGVADTTIANRLKKAGVQTRKTGAVKRELPMEQIISDYESGMSMIALGGKYRVSYNTLRTMLKEAGVQQERRGRKKIDVPMAQIWFEYESGMSPRELAKKYGVSRNTIRNRLKEAEKELN